AEQLFGYEQVAKRIANSRLTKIEEVTCFYCVKISKQCGRIASIFACKKGELWRQLPDLWNTLCFEMKKMDIQF
ncbi:hypothetical protein, partial [Eubacterium ramulus]|uniref:hypothetical protein n=1 Tax=Eubacterium ramulus TaxID=39490 RepID=UPI001A9A486C